MKSILFVIILLTITDCLNGNPQPTVQPHPTPIVVDTEYCAAAETNLQTLCDKDKVGNKYCCDTVSPTKKGKDFKTVCQDIQNNGIAISPRCLSTITACGQIDTCTGTK